MKIAGVSSLKLEIDSDYCHLSPPKPRNVDRSMTIDAKRGCNNVLHSGCQTGVQYTIILKPLTKLQAYPK